jgi:hypothetical protein
MTETATKVQSVLREHAEQQYANELAELNVN